MLRQTQTDWSRCDSVLTHFVMMNTSRDSAARSTRVLWSDLLWISLLSLLVSFWLPAVNQIITNLKTTNYDSLVENKRTDKSLYFPRKFINPFSWSRFACTNCQIFMTSKILMLNNTYGSDRHWSAQQNRDKTGYSFCWNSPLRVRLMWLSTSQGWHKGYAPILIISFCYKLRFVKIK